MSGRNWWRRVVPGVAVAVSVTGLAGCQQDAADGGAAGQAQFDAPTLRVSQLWEQPTISWGPGEVSGHWWLSSVEQPVPGSVQPAGRSPQRRTELGDASTGEVTAIELAGRVCDVVGVPSGSDGEGRFVVSTQRRVDDTCGLGVYDAATRQFVWERPLGPDEAIGAAGEEVVTLVRQDAGTPALVGCVELAGGAVVPVDDHRCVSAGEGSETTATDGDGATATLVGEWEGVRVVTTPPVPAADGSGALEPGTVRGIDTEGEVVWEGPAIDHRDGANWLFDWTDQVLATRWGPVLVNYGFGPAPSVPDLGDQPDATLTPLDPLTGESLAEIATLADSNVRWIVGDVLLAVKGGDYVSTWSGQQLVEGGPRPLRTVGSDVMRITLG